MYTRTHTYVYTRAHTHAHIHTRADDAQTTPGRADAHIITIALSTFYLRHYGATRISAPGKSGKKRGKPFQKAALPFLSLAAFWSQIPSLLAWCHDPISQHGRVMHHELHVPHNSRGPSFQGVSLSRSRSRSRSLSCSLALLVGERNRIYEVNLE